jgi:Ca2+-binding RTX toxin-like protein
MIKSTGRNGSGAIRTGLPAMTVGRAAVTFLAAIAVSLALGSATASTEGEIVVHGAESGSHLRLSVNGNNLVVDGYMAAGEQTGCHSHDRNTAVCPLAGAGGVEVDMGPSNDKVEVLNPLPLPLTTYMGKGEDKLIGNSEPDLCYPQGTRRNRCIGGAGNDICITGPRNTDCVGGAGNDYCKASTGSDGCWGGPGNDVCVMGPGKDGCHGEQGNDRLYGGPDPDQLYGGPGIDFCDGGPGVGKSHECESGPGH